MTDGSRRPQGEQLFHFLVEGRDGRPFCWNLVFSGHSVSEARSSLARYFEDQHLELVGFDERETKEVDIAAVPPAWLKAAQPQFTSLQRAAASGACLRARTALMRDSQHADVSAETRALDGRLPEPKEKTGSEGTAVSEFMILKQLWDRYRGRIAETLLAWKRLHEDEVRRSIGRLPDHPARMPELAVEERYLDQRGIRQKLEETGFTGAACYRYDANTRIGLGEADYVVDPDTVQGPVRLVCGNPYGEDLVFVAVPRKN